MENFNDKNDQTALSMQGAIALLRKGEICAFPTDTIYGLGAKASDAKAVQKLFAVKNRPPEKAIILLCADLAMAKNMVEFSPIGLELSRYWPGALTLVLPLKICAPIAAKALAVKNFLGVRVPANDLARQLISGVGEPIATTSANVSGKLPAVNAKQVVDQLGSKIPLLDGGLCQLGFASTILKVDGDKVSLLRKGAIPLGQIEARFAISISD